MTKAARRCFNCGQPHEVRSLFCCDACRKEYRAFVERNTIAAPEPAANSAAEPDPKGEGQ